MPVRTSASVIAVTNNSARRKRVHPDDNPPRSARRASGRIRRSCQARTMAVSIEARRLPHRAARRRTPTRTPPKGLNSSWIAVPRPLSGTFSRPSASRKITPHFLFHGTAVARRAFANPDLHVVVEITDGDARHDHVFRRCKERKPTQCLRCNQGVAAIHYRFVGCVGACHPIRHCSPLVRPHIGTTLVLAALREHVRRPFCGSGTTPPYTRFDNSS